MVKNAIKIYGRIKPVAKRKDVGQYFIQEGNKEDTLFLQVREREYHEEQHHKTELSQFKFYKVFDQHVRQHEIFSSVAKPIVDSVLQGYNGTVFAYGQTGSGKTFTITGGPDDFEDRGLIPRAIEYVFRKIATSDGSLYTVCVTYLQIYNEAAYDLLGHHQRMARLEDLPKLNLLDDTEGYLHIRNLSLHPVNSENEALNLLFLGDTNRAIAETPMNQASSRSHCMFTIHLAIRRTTWKNTRRAKLHFVDLAGSERLNKKGGRNTAGIDGRTINEARHINLSLHYLEQVITALAEAKRVHVPYRNCIITTMLRDSIGGNCLTSMVATLSLDHHHLPETLATCRFAQRVALVKNEATLNEDKDPMQEVSVLKAEVKRLKDQIRLLTNDKHYVDGHLTPAEEGECRELIEAFVENSQALELPMDLRKIEFCCYLLKEAVVEARRGNNSPKHERGSQHVEKCMQKLLQQRNNEIAILTELLRKERKNRMTSKSPKRTASPPVPKSSFDEYQKLIRQAGVTLNKHEQAALKKYAANPAHTNEVDNLKAQLKIRHTAAKKIHDKIEENKARIVESRKMLAKLENGIPVSSNVASRQKQLHSELKGILETEQSKYCSNLSILRDLKNECDHLTHSIKQAGVRFLHNFQCWWVAQGQAAILPKHTPPQEIPQKLVENPRMHSHLPASNRSGFQEEHVSNSLANRIFRNDEYDSHLPNTKRAPNTLLNSYSHSVGSLVNAPSFSSKLSRKEGIRKESSPDISGLKLQCLSRESMGDYFTCAELSYDDIQNVHRFEGSELSTSKSFQKENCGEEQYFSSLLKEQNASCVENEEEYNSWFPPVPELPVPPNTARTQRNDSASVHHDISQRTYDLVGDAFSFSENTGGTGDHQIEEEEKQETFYHRTLNPPFSGSKMSTQAHALSQPEGYEISKDICPASAGNETMHMFNGSQISLGMEGQTPPGTPPFHITREAKCDTNLAQFSLNNDLINEAFNSLHEASCSGLQQIGEIGSDVRNQYIPESNNLLVTTPQSLLHENEHHFLPCDASFKYLGLEADEISVPTTPPRLAFDHQIDSTFYDSAHSLLHDGSNANNTKERHVDKTQHSVTLNTNLQIQTNINSSEEGIHRSEQERKTQISLKDIPLTGDKEVDDEIIAFYEAKRRALQRQNTAK